MKKIEEKKIKKTAMPRLMQNSIKFMTWKFLRGATVIPESRVGAEGSENGNFLLFYVLKISLHRGVGGSKKSENFLT